MVQHTHGTMHVHLCVSLSLSGPIDTHARTHIHPHADYYHNRSRHVLAELHVYERIVEVDCHEAGWTL